MEFKNLIQASSMIRDVLGNIMQENDENKELAKSIEKLKIDLDNFDKIINASE